MWLFYLGLGLLLVGFASALTAIILELQGKTQYATIFAIIIVVSGPASILCLILRMIFFGGAAPSNQNSSFIVKPKEEKEVKTVDVKEVQKSQDEIMYDKYVDLYNRNLITKEDLDNKRKELLGK